MKKCHSCEAEWVSEKRQPGFKETCTGCSAYVHCCLNCRLYTPTAHNQCQSPTTEHQTDKVTLNFCEEFEFADAEVQARSEGAEGQARDALDNLFGGDDDPSDADRLDQFKDLFGE